MDELLAAFTALVSRAPHAILVQSERSGHSAADVDAAARAIAPLLPPPGKTGALAGLLAPNGAGFLAGLIALLRSGFAVVLADARTPAHERQRIALALGIGCWLEQQSPPGARRASFGVAVTSTRADLPLPASVVKLSSGSSGAPRGIAAPAACLLADERALAATMGLRADDRLLTTVPFAHSYGLSSLVLPALTRGVTLVVSESAAPLSTLQLGRSSGGSVFFTVPAFLETLLKLDAGPDSLPSSLRLVVSAGARLDPDTARRFRARFGRAVHAFYGASECGGICFDREGTAAEAGTVGTPVAGVCVELDDGRVTVSSPAVAAGYLPEAEDRLAGQRFVTDDQAEWRADALALVGRLGSSINVRGHTINPREIEQVIAELAPVREVHVLGIPGPDAGGPLVRAVVACAAGALGVEEILGWCRSHLASYKVPRSVVLVDRIPRTERGKVDRDWLVRCTADEPPG